MKIAICVPTGGLVKVQTFSSLVQLFRVLKFPWELLVQTGSLVHENRNILVRRALQDNFTHVLFVDSDMVCTPEIVFSLLSREKDIVGAISYARKLPLVATYKKFAEGFDIWEKHGDIIKCAGVGTGFMLIRTDVFKKLEQPWFMFTHDESGKLDYGEDMFFCRKAREAGFDIWLDTKAKVGHIGDYVFI